MISARKASGGCHACRARKTRCDQISEGCTQCKKAGRICPGYRSKGDLTFRDENANVVKRIKAKARKHPSNGPSKSPSPSHDSTTNSDYVHDSTGPLSSSTALEIVKQDQSSLRTNYSLAPTLEDRATTIFVYNFVVEVNGPTKGHFDRVADLSRLNGLDECLLAAMKAVGLAAYAHSAHAPSLLSHARFQYLEAIRLTNAALRDPYDVKKDSTLTAIQVLGLFESVTGSRQRSLKDWMEHVQGAAAVIKLRGKEQTKTESGRRMLVQVAANLLINCIHGSVRLPDHMRRLVEESFVQAPTLGPGFKVQETMMLFADLRASIKDGTIKGPVAVISRATYLDGLLIDIMKNVPVGWNYEVVTTSIESDIIFNGTYHVYYDCWIAMMWNSARTLRIMLNEVIRDALLEGFSSKPPIFTKIEHTALFQVATETSLNLQADILSSVPQHIGRGSPPRLFTNTFESTSALYPPMPMSNGTFLIWPLWFAGIMDNAQDDAREYAARILRWVGNVLGVQQAHVLAYLIETKSGIKVWNTAIKDLDDD